MKCDVCGVNEEMEYLHNSLAYQCRKCGCRRLKVSTIPIVNNSVYEGSGSIDIPESDHKEKKLAMSVKSLKERNAWLSRHQSTEDDVQVAADGREFVLVSGFRNYIPPKISQNFFKSRAYAQVAK